MPRRARQIRGMDGARDAVARALFVILIGCLGMILVAAQARAADLSKVIDACLTCSANATGVIDVPAATAHPDLIVMAWPDPSVRPRHLHPLPSFRGVIS